MCLAITIIGSIANKSTSEQKIYMYFFITAIFTLCFWMFFVDLFLGEKIQEEEDNLKILEIKDRARKGNMKDVIVIENNKIRNKILINNIEKLLLKGFKEGSENILTVETFMKNGKCLSFQIHEEKILSILSQKSKEAILDNVIDSITIEDLEQETMQVKINSKGCMVNERADNFNLDAWFKLKN